MPLLSPLLQPLNDAECLCNELPATATDFNSSANDFNDNDSDSENNDKVFSDQCFAVFQADANMAPKKKMRRTTAKTMSSSLDNKESRPKKTVHFNDEVVVEVEEETNDFPSIDFFIFNDNTTEKEQQCDSETEEEEEEPDEAIDTAAAETSDDLQQLYAEYRLEVEQLVRCSAAMGNEVKSAR